jgi:hypothetical protein
LKLSNNTTLHLDCSSSFHVWYTGAHISNFNCLNTPIPRLKKEIRSMKTVRKAKIRKHKMKFLLTQCKGGWLVPDSQKNYPTFFSHMSEYFSLFICASTVLVRTLAATQGRFRNLFGHSVELLWTSDQPVSKACTYREQHKETKTNIHALNGIRTHNLNFRAIKDFAWDCATTGTGVRTLYNRKVGNGITFYSRAV